MAQQRLELVMTTRDAVLIAKRELGSAFGEWLVTSENPRSTKEHRKFALERAHECQQAMKVLEMLLLH